MFWDCLLSPLIIQVMPPWVTITECIVDVGRRPKQNVSKDKKNGGKIAMTCTTRQYPRTFGWRQPKEVPETDFTEIFWVFLPDLAQLGDENGN